MRTATKVYKHSTDGIGLIYHNYQRVMMVAIPGIDITTKIHQLIH